MGDVVTDPLTYLTFGVGKPVEAAAVKAGKAAVAKEAERTAVERAVAKAAAKAGAKPLKVSARNKAAKKAFLAGAAKRTVKGDVKITPNAERFAPGEESFIRSQAENAVRATSTAPTNKGLQLGVWAFGKNAKTSGKTTAKLSKALGFSKATTRTRKSFVPQQVGRNLAPDFAPKGVETKVWNDWRQAERLRKGVERTETRRLARRLVPIVKAVSDDPLLRRQVIRSVERPTYYKALPKELQLVSDAVRQEYLRYGTEAREKDS